MIRKKSVSLLLSIFLISCSTNINSTNIINSVKENKSFGIKNNQNIVENNDLEYTGSWSDSGNTHQSTGTINNTDNSLVYKGNWITLNNNSATEGNYSYINNTSNVQIENDTSNNIKYIRGGWLTYSDFKYNNLYNSDKYLVSHYETDINKIKYIYGNNIQTWSSNMQYWRTYNQGGFNYTYSDYHSAKIEIPFSGTNIQIYQYKSSNRGICNIKVYDENNNIVRDLNIDNYSSTSYLSKTMINGLKNGNYKLLIQRTGNKNASSSGYIYDLAKVEVLPGIEYKFTGNDIGYNAFTANNCGKVAVTIDNNQNTTEIIDLYDSRNIYQNIYNKNNLGSGEQKITIDTIGEKNPSSSGFRININNFNAKPSVKGQFTGTFLNLKLIGTPDSGKADLYIDGILNREIDMYDSKSSFYSINIKGLTNTNHIFELVAKNTKRTYSTGTRINFDGYTTNKASYKFTGTSFKYFANKNNNQGSVDIFIDNIKHSTYNLYSPTLQTNQEIANITGISNIEHTIDIIPSGLKSSASTDYGINIDYFENKRPPKRVFWRGHDGNKTNIYYRNADGSGDIIKITDNNLYNNNFKVSRSGEILVCIATDIDTINVPMTTPSIIELFIKDINSNKTLKLPEPKVSFNSGIYLSKKEYIFVVRDDYNKVFSINKDFNGYFVSGIISGGLITPIKYFYDSNVNECPIVTWQENNNIFVKNADNYMESGTILSTNNTTENSYPKISSDCSKVVWIGKFNSVNHIFIRNSDGSNQPIQISINNENKTPPEISLDGTKVVWVSSIKIGETVNYIFNKPIISPIYENHIFIRNSDGSNQPIQLSTISTNNSSPQISPDGEKVVWSGTINGERHIFIKNSDGTGDTIQLSNSNTTANSKPEISN